MNLEEKIKSIDENLETGFKLSQDDYTTEQKKLDEDNHIVCVYHLAKTVESSLLKLESQYKMSFSFLRLNIKDSLIDDDVTIGLSLMFGKFDTAETFDARVDFISLTKDSIQSLSVPSLSYLSKELCDASSEGENIDISSTPSEAKKELIELLLNKELNIKLNASILGTELPTHTDFKSKKVKL